MEFYINNKGVAKGAEVTFKSVDFAYEWEELFLDKLHNMHNFPVQVFKGNRFYDIVYYYGDALNFAISEKLRNAFNENGITGWKTYDIDIKNADEKYYGLIPTGRCGPVQKPMGPGIKNVVGYNFDLKSWDGSDLFITSNMYFVVWSQRAVDLIQKLKIKNVEFINIKHYRWTTV